MNNIYKIKVTFKYESLFLKDILRKNIKLISSKKINNNIYILKVNEDDYYKLLKNSFNKIIILNTYGKIKIKKMFNKYLYIIIGILLSIIMLFILSNIIFKVEVVHSKKEIRNIIYRDLETYNIKKYSFKKSFKKRKEIVKAILKKEHNKVEWLEIVDKGTTYEVNVEERKINNIKKDYKTQNIIAKKDCMILQIEATKGEIVKKKYDYVKKGDVIVSGFVKNKEDVVSKVKANALVYGEVWYQVNVSLPKYYSYRLNTYKSKLVLIIKLLNKNYFIFNGFKDYNTKNYLTINNNLIPLSINFSNIEKVKVYKYNFDENTAYKRALLEASKELKRKLNKDDSIISKKVLKILEKKSKIEVDVFFKVKEDITDTASIENIKIEDENKLKEGE